MDAKYNSWSFYLIMICAVISLYSLYANIKNLWLITPPAYILLMISILALVLGMKGFNDKRNGWVKFRSWFTVAFSFVLICILFLAFIFSSLTTALGASDFIKTVKSPNESYTIDFYSWDAGAAGTFGIRGELNGPLWFKKRIYIEKRVMDVEVDWKEESVVIINGHTLNLGVGDTYGYK